MYNTIRLLFIITICSCAAISDSGTSADAGACPVAPDCGPVPPAPYWEYETTGGAPAKAIIPDYLWQQDLQWREKMRQWVECEHPGTWVQQLRDGDRDVHH